MEEVVFLFYIARLEAYLIEIRHRLIVRSLLILVQLSGDIRSGPLNLDLEVQHLKTLDR